MLHLYIIPNDVIYMFIVKKQEREV